MSRISRAVLARSAVFEISFVDSRDFGANNKAERWCSERNIAVGRMQRGEPRGLMVGPYDIAKWRNLSALDRADLDGLMTGNMRNGPVRVRLFCPPPEIKS